MREKARHRQSRSQHGSINIFEKQVERDERAYVIYESDALDMQVLPIKRVLK